ncbi:MAG: hypothetical protein J7L44_02975, partial [Candidatus Diapherotrites archaeon]|nr:hypothetical protein [Candidatus Diapherotrites archaeon]
MKSKFCREPVVIKFLHKNAGKDAVDVVDRLLNSKKPLKDEEIAEKIGLRVTEVRTILNRLHYRGIANYGKERDEKTGWYTYTWTIDKKRMVELIISELNEMIEKLEKEKKLQENYTMFTCEAGCVELPFEVAAEYNFKCPECGRDMNCSDPKVRKRNLSRQMN